MEKSEIFTTVTNYVVENFYYGKEGSVQGDTNLMEDGAVDSTGFMELVTFVEDKFPVSVDDEDLTPENFATIERIVEYILSKVSSQVA